MAGLLDVLDGDALRTVALLCVFVTAAGLGVANAGRRRP